MERSGNGDVVEEPAGRRRSGRGWYGRGYLPHYDVPGLLQFVTFRLHDSVPAQQIVQWKQELGWQEGLEGSEEIRGKLIRKIEAYADAGYGACWLRDERVYAVVEGALKRFDGEWYRLLEWAIMPNHVHVLIEVMRSRQDGGDAEGSGRKGRRDAGAALADIVHAWKSYTAKQANKLLERRGVFWMREYFDRYIRDREHYERVARYIREQGKSQPCQLRGKV